MNVRLLPAAALMALAALTGCGGGVASSLPAAPALAAHKSEPIVVSPKSLDFTSGPKLTLKISENAYHGDFTIKIGSKTIVKTSKSSVKGPVASLKVTALAAGATTLTISNASHHSVKVPVSVTTAVVVVQ